MENGLDLMLDLETLGTKIGSPVITIGAVLFCPTQPSTVEGLLRRSILLRINMTEAVNHSVGVDGSTIEWWFNQSDEAIKAAVAGDALSTRQALEKLYHYAMTRAVSWTEEFFPSHPGAPKPQRVWAKSPDFDCKMMEWLYGHIGSFPWPFKYSEYRCVRTLQDLAWPSGPADRPTFDVGAKHDARADAVEQALTVQAGYRVLGLSQDDTTFTDYRRNKP